MNLEKERIADALGMEKPVHAKTKRKSVLQKPEDLPLESDRVLRSQGNPPLDSDWVSSFARYQGSSTLSNQCSDSFLATPYVKTPYNYSAQGAHNQSSFEVLKYDLGYKS